MNKWFLRTSSKTSAKFRLFCLPYAGGDSSIYTPWVNQIPDFIELLPIQLPGRSIRIQEPAISSMTELVDQIYLSMLPLLDKPYMLLGHSLGGRVGFELLHKINKTNAPPPKHFIASGSKAPHLPRTNNITYNLPDEEFIEELRKLNGTPSEVINNRELMEFLLPMLKADFCISDNHVTKQKTLLDCSISVFHGEEDTLVSESDARAWQKHFSKPINFQVFSGGHFFINENSDDLLSSLKSILRRELMNT